ncbi:MAG: GH116 family glycosyl hydrolase [Bacillota bacterium]
MDLRVVFVTVGVAKVRVHMCGTMHRRFPSCFRSWNVLRDLDYKYNMLPDGGMSFRLKLPIGSDKWAFRPCVDGHFGGIIKLCRDWKISGRDDWMKSHWDAVKRNIAYAWNPESTEKWDLDMNGVIEGRQHHTLDMELFGPNAWLTGIYLAALKAACEMGDFIGDTEATAIYRKLFDTGRTWVDENLFNGKFYFHQINLEDKSILNQFGRTSVYGNDDMIKAYWNDEAGEIKYQMGEGCAVDQVLGQWLSNVSCLGEILDKTHVRSALKSIYDNNFKSMRDFFNPCRLYSLNDEEGVIICSWPEGSRRPVVPAPYSEETMNGFEYQVAVHMIQEGMVEEGLEIVRAIRNRYDGERRNPWNEFECGSNYARSMASYALINAFTGLEFDFSAGHIGFSPIQSKSPGEEFKGFWSVGEAWGNIVFNEKEGFINIAYGNLDICSVSVPKDPKAVFVDGKAIPFSVEEGRVVFNETLSVQQKIKFVY